MKNFYSVIIGTELLNGRRKDAHFEFINEQIIQRGWKHQANFMVGDDVKLLRNVFNLIKKDKNSVMFSFGGIGATPDDYTRQVAADVFTNGITETNKIAKTLILEEFKDTAYPHRIKMANLPKNAKLLENVVNKVPGFYLEDRFFFTPGFVSMSHAMIIEAFEKVIGTNKTEKFIKNFIVKSSENAIIDIMESLPKTLEFSSLPKIKKNGKKRVEIFLSSDDEKLLEKSYNFFINSLTDKQIDFKNILQ